MKKTQHIILNSTPILVMIGLIPIIVKRNPKDFLTLAFGFSVRNDYLLAGIYILIILFALKVKRNPKDFFNLIFWILGDNCF